MQTASCALVSNAPGPVIWNSPSKEALDSMPLSGRKGAGANIWVQDGSIWFYLAHNSAYDENGNLLKLGCVCIEPESVRLGGDGFTQTLDPATGIIAIEQDGFQVKLWFAEQALVVESSNSEPHYLELTFGMWRDNTDMAADESGFWWSHRNAGQHFNLTDWAQKQGIDKTALHDITTNRTFGGAIAVEGGISLPAVSDVQWQLWKGRAWTAKTVSKAHHTIVMAFGAGLEAKPDEWRKRAEELLKPESRDASRMNELARWKQFWERSYIVINPEAGIDDAGRLVSRNYQLFRYMLACNRDGEFPLLFNGGIFTTDVAEGRITGNTATLKKRPGQSSPDFRRWGQTHFMSQNQRWLGWPTLASGDADLLEPTLAFYRQRALTAAARAKNNGAEGVVYPEPMDIWGLCAVKPMANGFCESVHLTFHFSMMIESAWMALQAHDALGIDIDRDLPWITGTVLFYDSYYRNKGVERTGKELGPDGKLIIYPCNGLELLSGATNPVEVVCGLRRVTDGLLALPGLSGELHKRFQEIQQRLPEIPIGVREGKQCVLEAKSFEDIHNKWEPIEMYSFWPYRFFGVTRPDTLQIARNTWDTVPLLRRRCIDEDYSWMANVVNVSALARPQESRKRVIYKLANNSEPQARFSAFFGPGHDWIPDHNWGGSGMVGLQEMLLAPEPGREGKLYMFSSWPADWNVRFKLHAPGPAVVECEYSNRKIQKLSVTPKAREKDIVNWLDRVNVGPEEQHPL